MLFIAGICAGMLGGFLGIGGGIILMPFLRFGAGLSPAYAAGTCILAVFFTTLGGGFRHYRLGHVPIRSIWPVIIAGVLSTLAFSLLFAKLAKHGSLLDLGIGCVMVMLALYMTGDALYPLLSKKRKPDSSDASFPVKPELSRKTGLGFLAGILPGLFGIGTGAVLVPGFTYLLKMPVKLSIGSALVCFSANAFVSSAIKLQQGYVVAEVALPIGAGCLIGAQAGALINKRTPSPFLKAIFGLLFTWVALRFITSGLAL